MSTLLVRLMQEEDKNDTDSTEVTASPTPALNTLDTTQNYDMFPSQSVLGLVFVLAVIAIAYYCRRKLTKQPSVNYSRVPQSEEPAGRHEDPNDDFEDWPDDDVELSKVHRSGSNSIPHVTNLNLSPKDSSAPRTLTPVGTIAPPVIKPISSSSSGELRSRSTTRNTAPAAKSLRPTSLDPSVDIFETIGIGAAPKFNTTTAQATKPEARRTLQDKVGDLEVGDASSWNDDDLDLE